MKTDKGRFDAVLSRMISTPPQKTAEIKAPKKIHTDAETCNCEHPARICLIHPDGEKGKAKPNQK